MAEFGREADVCNAALSGGYNVTTIKAFDGLCSEIEFRKPSTQRRGQSPTEVFIDSGSDIDTQIGHGGSLNHRFDVICRFCLEESECMMDIFDSSDCIMVMVESIAGVQIDADDMFPKNICSNCYDLLNQCITFKQQVVSADIALRQCINQPEPAEKQFHPTEVTNQECSDDPAFEVIDECEEFDSVQNLEEEDYPTDYEMVYETTPILYSDCDGGSGADENDTISYSPENHSEEVSATGDTVETSTVVDFNEEQALRCGKCDKTFSNQSFLTKHMKSHTTKKSNHECPVCKKTFPHLASLECHLTSHRSGSDETQDQLNSFKCAKCNEKFTVERDLYIHGSIHPEDDKLRCRECDKDFPNLSKLKRHVKTHYEDKPVKCERCGRGFPEMASLTRHYRIHTKEPRDRKYVCKECDKAYYDSHSLAVHVRTHTGERPWVCTKCDKRFTDSRLLNSHMRTHTNVRKFSCSICDKSFTHRSTLISHTRTHTGEKPFVCKVCGKSFIQSSNLMLHLRVHSGEKPYKCSKCPKAFGSSSTLALHVRTHTGEKPYACKQCGKRFARHNLTIHMRTHTGEKPYECTECLRKFTTTGQLVQHKRTHTDEKRYACEICNKKLATPTCLKKHMQIHLVSVEAAGGNSETIETAVLEKNDPYHLQKHRLRIEEIQSDAEFNENAMLVNDLLASVVNVNADVLQSGNVEIPELSTYDTQQDLGEMGNVINPGSFCNQDSKEESHDSSRVFVTEA